MKNDVQTKTDVQMTEQEVSEKFNRGRKVIDFVGSKKIFFGVSLGIMLIGIICNFIFGTTLDIQFSGGATLTFSYTSDEEHPIDQNALYDFIQEKTTDKITTSFSEDLMGNTGKNVSVQFSGNDSIETDIQKNLEKDLQAQYPDNNFITLEANSVDASMGFSFLLKCLAAVALASILMVLYVTIRFKKIGGLSAGVMALVALFHDVAMIYFLYVIFQMPIDSNFIAVVLNLHRRSSLGYVAEPQGKEEGRKIIILKNGEACFQVSPFCLQDIFGVRVLAVLYGRERLFCFLAFREVHIGVAAFNVRFHLSDAKSYVVHIVVNQQSVDSVSAVRPLVVQSSAFRESVLEIVAQHIAVYSVNRIGVAVHAAADVSCFDYSAYCAGCEKG